MLPSRLLSAALDISSMAGSRLEAASGRTNSCRGWAEEWLWANSWGEERVRWGGGGSMAGPRLEAASGRANSWGGRRGRRTHS